MYDQLKNEFEFTSNPNEAIFIFPDGSMIDGLFDCGYRGEDHNGLRSYFATDWAHVHDLTGVVRLVPETKEALIKTGQKLTDVQTRIIKKLHYIVDAYC